LIRGIILLIRDIIRRLRRLARGDVMAEKIRDHLANERTFLAWVRTALGLIGLGFVLARMGLFLRQFALTAWAAGPGRNGSASVPDLHAGHEFLVTGVVFLVIGAAFAGWSGWLYACNRRAIDADRFEPARWSVLVLTSVIVVGSLGIIGLVIWRVLVEG
jgi:putative membrane protein